MRRKKNISGRKLDRKNERGVVITLVAVFMLAVLGAMAALSIDVVTIYTARSEAQLAADSAALAGARVLANSGMTSDPSGSLAPAAESFAQTVAIQIAQSNPVGGRDLIAVNGEVVVGFPASPPRNPTITVNVQRADLPTFFARIWGTRQVTVGASATAEAYNPSNSGGGPPLNPVVEPICVKPWLLPNIDPSKAGSTPIFDPTSGAIMTSTLLGWTSTPGGVPLTLACTSPSGTCATPLPAALAAWNYFPGDD